jgi:probable F420-dependent oxidoreductase
MQRFSLFYSVRENPLPAWLAPAVEAAGLRRIWLGSAPGDLASVAAGLAATSTLQFATGIVNIWRYDAATTASAYHRLDERYPGRFLLGIGTGHPEVTAAYVKPYEAISRYLDVLDDRGVPVERRVLAALGPRMLRLARDRSAGAHPYLVPPAHTTLAREILGPDRLLAPEHKIVLSTDVRTARAVGRPKVAKPYLGLVNYTANLKRLGFTDADIADGGSDALIDAVVAHGTADQVTAEVGRHIQAGADEVPIQILTADPTADLTKQLTELAPALNRWESARE